MYTSYINETPLSPQIINETPLSPLIINETPLSPLIIMSYHSKKYAKSTCAPK